MPSFSLVLSSFRTGHPDRIRTLISNKLSIDKYSESYTFFHIGQPIVDEKSATSKALDSDKGLEGIF
jgi:hypothetical protein